MLEMSGDLAKKPILLAEVRILLDLDCVVPALPVSGKPEEEEHESTLIHTNRKTGFVPWCPGIALLRKKQEDQRIT
jgi:hypothetical protein